MTIIDDAVDAWADIARREVAAGLAVNHCILGTRVLIDVLDQLDIPTRVVPVECLVANQRAVPLIEAKVPVPDWPPEAWSVGATTMSPGGGYPGHLILVADGPDGRVLVDSATRQFFRPQYGIMAPWTITAKVPAAWPERDGAAVVLRLGSWQISWASAVSRLGNRHRSASDWNRGRAREYVDEILDTLSHDVRQ